MNQRKLGKLFTSARAETPPVPPAEFASRMMRVIRQEPRGGDASILNQLAALFPRLTLAAAVVIGLCLTADFCLTTFVQQDLSSTVAAASEQWLFAVR